MLDALFFYSYMKQSGVEKRWVFALWFQAHKRWNLLNLMVFDMRVLWLLLSPSLTPCFWNLNGNSKGKSTMEPQPKDRPAACHTLWEHHSTEKHFVGGTAACDGWFVTATKSKQEYFLASTYIVCVPIN